MRNLMENIKLWFLFTFWKVRHFFSKEEASPTGPFLEDDDHFSAIPQESYRRLFQRDQMEPHIYMNQQMFERITNRLPRHYRIPNQTSLQTIERIAAYRLIPRNKKPERLPKENEEVVSTDHIAQTIRDKVPVNYQFPTPLLSHQTVMQVKEGNR
ncbi:hypothetical protein J416_09906 [Gracilibacillus halophilus YIM-C55.5]|uniref:Uncharacterized protein n=1 Tax=Gracilibacillus halophilus YIM-C55.5 TaxID=1308866 RepID=N4WBJ4_9BACI|nr:hypothetical protein [Gracilibacillus halophilus]ENH96609.1 hypothetical protein J416_09906 [Gracilibacillus halophilus YIM-C55.5]